MSESKVFMWVAVATMMFGAVACVDAPPSTTQAPVGTAEAPIVNGVNETGWQGVGALVYEHDFYGYQGSFCTATLIAPQWLITAAHCVTGDDAYPASDVFFYVGSDARPRQNGSRPTGSFFQALQFYPHPQYDEWGLDNDIALVRLAANATGVPTYPTNTSFLNASGQDAFYVGFGATSGITEAGSGVKRSVSFEIGYIYDKYYISEYEGAGGTCFGDSGGPAFFDFSGTSRIIGITSAGLDCNPNQPGCDPDPCKRDGIYTRVDAYASWIANTMNAPAPNCNTNASLCACADACQANGQCNNTACQTGSCSDTYDCFYQCGDDGQCQNACYDAATTIAKGQVVALDQCLSDHCASAQTQSELNDCVGAFCPSEYNACFPLLTGSDTCEEIVDCYNGCADGDCAYACIEQGTATAQQQFDALLTCAEDSCGSVPDAQYQSCFASSCGAQINACFPPANCPIQGGGCGAGNACYPTTGGATDCYPSNNKGLGAACADSDTTLDCADGAICVDGACEALCSADVHCGGGVICEAPIFSDVASIGICGCEDKDRDGACADVDCDDQQASTYPGAAEACGDGVDNNCVDGVDEGCSACTDADQDGYCAAQDCNDADAAVRPNAGEKCGDAIDNNCNSLTDEGCEGCVDADADGYCAAVDCFDDDAASNPGAAEVCGDGKDNNCSGAAEEGCPVDPNNPNQPLDPNNPNNPQPTPGTTDSSGCAGAGSMGGALFGLFGLLSMLVVRRRRTKLCLAGRE